MFKQCLRGSAATDRLLHADIARAAVAVEPALHCTARLAAHFPGGSIDKSSSMPQGLTGWLPPPPSQHNVKSSRVEMPCLIAICLRAAGRCVDMAAISKH